ncbi:hypothetical protein IM697_11620 [Streptomyces ferrugineus]|uniref:DUF4034 domain-containing protein n=1 Tax=Streptomyces ferrugineus TaxID=1413221 RepID=A0A7M2STY3_9ACTN|nr:hypothetical protein [Streptomyces ferrugineus]QOV38968.1 hypothetical protein IM697_11620 [Streptomyces ferrugineus]
MASMLPFGRASRTTAERPVTGLPADVTGLPADDDVLLDAPDDRLGPALVAAGQGAYEPAAELLAATRRHAQWEHRDTYTLHLAAFARSRPEWLQSWYATAPQDPDALLIRAQLAVDHAWRSPARAETLRGVSPMITAAARADDRDPVPWRIALDHARGSRAGHTYFGELWEAALRRAPRHYGCHVAALHYLASSWHGSHRECLDFADRAAQDTPADSLVQALPTRAVLAYLNDGCGPGVPRERLDAAADRAIALSARFPATDVWPAAVRNKLTYVLVRLGRWEDALEQLRLIGPYATSFPWSRLSDDPLGRFLEMRDEVRVRAAQGAGRGHPPGGRARRVHCDDH